MPLIPSTMNPTTSSGSGNDKTSHWTNLLMGKKIGDKTTETSFAKDELPSKHRVLGQDSMATMDFQEDRLNVHVDEDGVVNKVTHG